MNERHSEQPKFVAQKTESKSGQKEVADFIETASRYLTHPSGIYQISELEKIFKMPYADILPALLANYKVRKHSRGEVVIGRTPKFADRVYKYRKKQASMSNQEAPKFIAPEFFKFPDLTNELSELYSGLAEEYTTAEFTAGHPKLPLALGKKWHKVKFLNALAELEQKGYIQQIAGKAAHFKILWGRWTEAVTINEGGNEKD
jgi:hypothetical protein